MRDFKIKQKIEMFENELNELKNQKNKIIEILTKLNEEHSELKERISDIEFEREKLKTKDETLNIKIKGLTVRMEELKRNFIANEIEENSNKEYLKTLIEKYQWYKKQDMNSYIQKFMKETENKIKENLNSPNSVIFKDGFIMVEL